MKTNRGWLLLALPCVLAACGGDEDTATTEGMDTTSMVSADTAGSMAAMPTSLALQSVGGSTAMGQATVTPAGTETQVSVQLSGLTPGDHPGHIHMGTCDAIGEVVHPLPTVTAGDDGTATVDTTITASADSFLNGGHVISYHGTETDPGAPVACGELMGHVM